MQMTDIFGCIVVFFSIPIGYYITLKTKEEIADIEKILSIILRILIASAFIVFFNIFSNILLLLAIMLCVLIPKKFLVYLWCLSAVTLFRSDTTLISIILFTAGLFSASITLFLESGGLKAKIIKKNIFWTVLLKHSFFILIIILGVWYSG